MKYLVGFVAFLLLAIGAIYGLVFTQPGNDFLRPIIEKRITAKVPLPTALETFTLRPDRFEVSLRIGKETLVAAKGTINLLSRSINATYRLEIKELFNLKKLIEKKLNGPFMTHGTIKGSEDSLAIDGIAKIAGSDTDYHLKLRDFKPSTLQAKIKHLQIDKLLYMVDQPIYATGLVDIDANLPTLDMEHLKGNVTTKISKGILHTVPIQKDFNLSIPEHTTFHGDIHTKLVQTKAISDVEFITSLATLHSKHVIYDIEKEALSTDYKLHVPNLDALYFVTKQHMKGAMTVTGDITADKKDLTLTAHTDTLGGAIDAKMVNEKVKVKIANIQTVALTDMLLYPHIFDSRANMRLDFNTKTQKGKIDAELLNGQILPNKMTFLLQQIANFDITREVYERTTLVTTIDKKILYNDLHMKSRLTELDAKKAVINLGEETIDATLNVKIREAFVPVILKGALKDPSVKIDANNLIKAKAKQELQKKMGDKLKNTPAGNLLNNLF